MKRGIFRCSLCGVAAAVILSACGAGIGLGVDADLQSSVATTLYPGGTDVEIDAAVLATFSAAVSTSYSESQWQTLLTLRRVEGGVATGVSLCTAVTYDADALTATCAHTALNYLTTYEVALWYVQDADGLLITGSSQQFTTTSALPVATLTSKTSVTQTVDGEGQLTLTLAFDQAPAVTPTVSVAETVSASAVSPSAAKAAEGGACSAVEGSETDFTCVVTGLSSCQAIVDYTATISVGGLEAGTILFNTADDEFDSEATLDACWAGVEVRENAFKTRVVQDGVLVMTLVTEDVGDTYITIIMDKEKGDAEDFSVSAHISSFERVGAEDGFVMLGLASDMLMEDGGLVAGLLFDDSAETYSTQVSGSPPTWQATGGGDAPSYSYCLVKHADTVRLFLSFDDATWVAGDSYTLFCSSGDCGDFTAASSSWPEAVGLLFFNNIDESQTMTSKVSYVRFNTNIVNGDANDCPSLD